MAQFFLLCVFFSLVYSFQSSHQIKFFRLKRVFIRSVQIGLFFFVYRSFNFTVSYSNNLLELTIQLSLISCAYFMLLSVCFRLVFISVYSSYSILLELILHLTLSSCSLVFIGLFISIDPS